MNEGGLELVQSPAVASTKINETATVSGLQSLDDRFCGWYAAFTLTRHEKRVAAQCEERQIESFLPLYSVKHRWKNRCSVVLELPLFPNYLFVRIDPRQRLRVVKIPGVVSIVSGGRELLPVPDHHITALRAGLLTRTIEPHSNLEVGDRVCITTGPIAGMEGILERQKNELRVVLKLEMIGRSVSVEVGAEEIELVGPTLQHTRPVPPNSFLSPMARISAC